MQMLFALQVANFILTNSIPGISLLLGIIKDWDMLWIFTTV